MPDRALPRAGLAVFRCRRFWRLAFAVLLALGAVAPADAAVSIAFYSRELGGNNFPHAFVVIDGTLDATGAYVHESYGFTAKAVTPLILFGSVAGEVIDESPHQVERSTRQFSVTMTDSQYGAVVSEVQRWRELDQPSYNLNRRNCIHFVAALAAAVGLRVDYPHRLMKRPRSYLEHIRAINPQLAAVN